VPAAFGAAFLSGVTASTEMPSPSIIRPVPWPTLMPESAISTTLPRCPPGGQMDAMCGRLVWAAIGVGATASSAATSRGRNRGDAAEREGCGERRINARPLPANAEPAPLRAIGEYRFKVLDLFHKRFTSAMCRPHQEVGGSPASSQDRPCAGLIKTIFTRGPLPEPPVFRSS
jgi:hypothetical protein